MLKSTLLVFGLASSLLGQETGNIGIFEGASAVGEVAKKAVTFEPTTGEYRMTGSGANIWAKRDDFYFLWRKLSGDVTLTATVRFGSTEGEPHRKVVLMIRKGLETGSPQVNAAVHANGLATLSYREAVDDTTRSVRFPVNGPTRLRLERRGNWYTFYAGKAGQPLAEAGSIQMSMTGPVYIGLGVCPHDAQAEMTAIFSDVTIETPAPAGSSKSQQQK